MKENIECEYPDAHGNMSDREARVLKEAHDRSLVQISEPSSAPSPSPVLIDAPVGESPALATIKAEMAIGSTRADIVKALKGRNIAPPAGKRTWTVATVSKIVKEHGIEKPRRTKPPRDRVLEYVEKVGGTWRGYWHADHPLTHVHLLDAPAKPDTPSANSSHVTCNSSALLTAVVGYATTPQRALAERPVREDIQ